MSRILIAEDESRIASFLEKGLRANGFTTDTISDGESALRLARSGHFDLLILDIGLPQMDGFEVLRQLRAAGTPLPVIILTARDHVQDTVAGLEGGADDYITKPFRFEELLARVRGSRTMSPLRSVDGSALPGSWRRRARTRASSSSNLNGLVT